VLFFTHKGQGTLEAFTTKILASTYSSQRRAYYNNFFHITHLDPERYLAMSMRWWLQWSTIT
tara:strand:+ start:143 stop:328 length:186 start_codon:yes stop_codon:yes gene_type:complete